MAANLSHALYAAYCEPWLMSSVRHMAFFNALMDRNAIAGGESVQRPVDGLTSIANGIARIDVRGVLMPGFSDRLYDAEWNVTSTDVLADLLHDARMTPEIKGVMLYFDSPGGMVRGTPEAAEAVEALAETKPVVSYAAGLLASAAYYIAAPSDLIHATRSARVGSIGVYQPVLDSSRFAEMMGLRVEMFKSGANKGVGYPGTSLTDKQREIIQAEVDHSGAEFRAAVVAGRARKFPDEVLDGRDFSAVDGLAVGLIDGITDAATAMRDAARLADVRATTRR